MKKISLLFLLLVFPVCVFAKDNCDPSNIKIESITLEDTKGNIEEIKKASSSVQKINLGLRMNVVGDTASYKIVLKNNSNEDYYFDEKSLNLDTDYVDYTVSYEDDNNIIKGGEEKVLFLKVVYKEKMDSSTLENGLYQDTQVVKLNLTNNNLVDEILENPLTGRKLGLLIFIFLIVGCILFYKEKKKSAYLFLLIGLTLPFSVQALCRHSLEIENELVIDAREAVFLPGQEVNVKMKQLAGDDTSTVTNAYAFKDETITSIQYSEVEPDSINKEEKNIVSTPESEYPIYMWYDNGTIYWWSEDKTPSLNEDASFMFNHIQLLNNIVGLETFDVSNNKNMNSLLSLTSLKDLSYLKNWNTSNVESMSSSFLNIYCLESLSGLENWNTSKVTTMNSLFSTNLYLNNIDAIKNWNVENVENMSMMFLTNLKLEEIDLSNWNTSSLKDMSFMIGMGTPADGTKAILKRIILSDKFDTSNVTDMSFAFYNNNVIEDYTFLKILDTSNVTTIQDVFYNNWNLDSTEFMKDWDVSNIKNMSAAFIGTNLTSLDNFINWNTISVTDMSYMFRDCYSLESLNGIENWDVSQVNNYRSMFDGDNKINNASSINEWNVSKTADFTRMFAGVPVLPEFSKVNGVWKNGTFTPGS